MFQSIDITVLSAFVTQFEYSSQKMFDRWFNNQNHKWQLIGKTYASPKDATNITEPKLQEKALFGVTTLLWEDQLTGETKTEEVLGSDDSQLEALCEKAEKYGMQYITRNDKQFAIALVPPDDNIPLR